MTTPNQFDRRTALKTLGAAAIGTTAIPGIASATGDEGRRRGPTNVLEITGKHTESAGAHHQFELSDSTISPGWTTVKFDNQTGLNHFVYVVKLPDAESRLAAYDGSTLREKYLNAVTYPFQAEWDPYYAGDIDVGTFFGNLLAAAPLFLELVPVGGPGLTTGPGTSMTTVNFEPGHYFLECYVLDDSGVFHSAMGMLEHLEVTGDSSSMPEPSGTLDLSLSTEDGIEFGADAVRPGRHTVEVTFEDNTPYGNGLRHDVHLIRFEDGTDTDALNGWMDYLDVGAGGFYADDGALTTTHSDPGPVTFLGGVQDVATDLGVPSTAYMDVVLTPGDYAWVAEIPDPAGSGFLNQFSVPGEGEGTGPT